MLNFHQLLHPVRDGLDADPLEIIVLASRQDRDRYLVHLRGSQDENNILRRLLQRLQQGVERSDGKHVYLVDDIDLVPPLRRTVCDLFPDLTDIVHAVIGRRVDLDHIHGSPRCDRSAHLTFPARASIDRMLAVYRLRKYLRHRRLSRSSCSAEQISMPDTVCLDLIL